MCVGWGDWFGDCGLGGFGLDVVFVGSVELDVGIFSCFGGLFVY